MWNRKRSVTLSIVVCFIFTLILTLGLFFGPWVVSQWLGVFRGLSAELPTLKEILTVFCVCFYPSSVYLLI